MGLSSLIKVAQGKNAGDVSFEDNFLKEYEKAVQRQEERERQPYPEDYFRPSSMYGCMRMLFFQRYHARVKYEGGKEKQDTNLIEICNSGTDRHLRIQHLVADMEGVTCLDLEEAVKEANQKGIKTEFVGWNEDHTEGRCKNDELSIYFQPDGVLRFMGKDVILEIKTESTYQHSNRYEPKEDHKYQATCYGMGLGIEYVLFLYEDRNFCGKKAYLWKITEEMKEAVLKKIHTVNEALKVGIPPEKDESKCTYCPYKNECGLVDAGKWVSRDVTQSSQEAHAGKKKKNAKKNSTKAKKTKKRENTGSHIPKLCRNCTHCTRENIGGDLNCIINLTAPITPVKPNTRCKHPEKFTPTGEAVEHYTGGGKDGK